MPDSQRLPGLSGSDAPVDEISTYEPDLSTELEGDEVADVTDITDDQTNPAKPSKTPEQLDYERRQAVKASLANNQKAKTAQAQASAYFNSWLNTARKNPAVLDTLYETDPTLADEVTSQLPQFKGMTYQEAVAKVQADANRPETDDVDARIEAAIERRLAAERNQEVSKTVSSTEEDLFMNLAAKYSVKSFEYKKVRDEYRELGSPQNAKQAKAFFKLALEVLEDEDGQPVDMASIPSIAPRGARSSRPTLESLGLSKDVIDHIKKTSTPEQIQEFIKRKSK